MFALALLGALILATTYWQSWAAPGLANRKENAIQVVAQFTIERGKIFAADGKTVLATNTARKVNGRTLYFRRYPTRGLAAHVVGYSTQVRSRAGLERSMNDFLTGSNANLSTVVDTQVDKLLGRHVVGNDLHLTLNARAQRVALQALGRNCGSVVAIEPSTGRVLVMANSPTYDPNLIETDYRSILRARANCPQAAPLLNRATQGRYVPGSTFKIVTAAAALESGQYTMETRKTDPGYCMEYGRRVNNYDTTSPFGSVTLFQAIQYSINSYFCEIGKDLGPGSDRAGDEGLRLLLATAARDARERAARERPLQERPTLRARGLERGRPRPARVRAVRAAGDAGADGDGRVRRREPRHRHAAVRRRSRRRPRRQDGHANEAPRARPDDERAERGRPRRRDGGRRAGGHRHGRADSRGSASQARPAPRRRVATGLNQTAFIAFAPVEAPRVAIAVMLENQSGTGGSTAAPIAKQVLQALLRGP